MNKIVKVTDNFFGFFWFIQLNLMKMNKTHSRIIQKLHDIALVTLLALIIIVALANWLTTASYIIFCAFTITVFVLDWFTEAIKTLTTVSGFITHSILATIVISMILWQLLSNVLESIFSSSLHSLISYALICISIAIVWSFYSILCNNQVATLVNGVLTVILSVLANQIELIINILPNSFWNKHTSSIPPELLLEYTPSQYVKLIVSIISFPVINMLAFATIVCLIKQYWIKQYNEDKDINRDLVY